MRKCQFHPDRPGVGICMRCRAVVCPSCCTRIDGINHCHACLRTLAGSGEKRPNRRSSAVVAGIILSVAWLLLFALCWLVGGKIAP